MPKAYKVVKRTIMFDKENPRNVYTVAPDYHPRPLGEREDLNTETQRAQRIF